MTHREKLTAQMRRLSIVPGLAFVWMIVSAISVAWAPSPWVAVRFLAGLVPFVVGLVFLQLRLRCLRCRNALGRIAMAMSGAPFRFSKRLRFCPFCGLDLDTPAGEPVVSNS